jgi:hypothetical protein
MVRRKADGPGILGDAPDPERPGKMDQLAQQPQPARPALDPFYLILGYPRDDKAGEATAFLVNNSQSGIATANQFPSGIDYPLEDSIQRQFRGDS